MTQLESMEHDYIRILKSQFYKQVGVERRVLELESEVARASGSIPTRGNILLLDFLFSHHVVKSLVPIFALLPILFGL